MRGNTDVNTVLILRKGTYKNPLTSKIKLIDINRLHPLNVVTQSSILGVTGFHNDLYNVQLY